MNYAAIYDRLIERARRRVVVGYSESHHILPRCMGGLDSEDNLVRLTPEEHFVAHQLLVKMHPGVRGLVFGLKAMTIGPRGTRANNKLFGWMRKRYSAALSEKQKGRPVPDHVAAMLRTIAVGRKASEEERARRSTANKLAASRRPAGPNGFQGRKHTPETKAKMSAAHARRWTEEVRAQYRARALEQKAQGKFCGKETECSPINK